MSKLEQICKFYQISASQGKDIVGRFPPFAGLDHRRVVEEATAIYGKNNAVKVKEAILKFPPFAGLDHRRVLRQKTRIGRLIGLANQEAINIILENPVQAGYSYKRDLARIDVVRRLKSEGLEITNDIKNWFISNYIRSPYSQGKLRVSHANGTTEPQLLTYARNKFALQLSRQ